MKRAIILLGIIFTCASNVQAAPNYQKELDKVLKQEEVFDLSDEAIGGNHAQLLSQYIKLSKGETVEIIKNNSKESPDIITIYRAGEIPKISIVKYKDKQGKIQNIEYMLFDEQGNPIDSEYGID